jgi:hypothetical protein
MALIHEFTIIEKQSSINFIENGMDKIDVSDSLILYMGDSLRWIETCCYNMQTTEKGLDYYGYTIIKDENIIKFKSIVTCWRNLFEEAPLEFILTGNFLPDENTYEKNLYNKQEVIHQLNALEIMCNEAQAKNGYILHNGI